MKLTTKRLKQLIREELSRLAENKQISEIRTMYFNYTPQTKEELEKLSYEIAPRQGGAVHGTITGRQNITRLTMAFQKRGDDGGSASYEIMKDFAHGWSKYLRFQKGVDISPKAFMEALKEKDYKIEIQN